MHRKTLSILCLLFAGFALSIPSLSASWSTDLIADIDTSVYGSNSFSGKTILIDKNEMPHVFWTVMRLSDNNNELKYSYLNNGSWQTDTLLESPNGIYINGSAVTNSNEIALVINTSASITTLTDASLHIGKHGSWQTTALPAEFLNVSPFLSNTRLPLVSNSEGLHLFGESSASGQLIVAHFDGQAFTINSLPNHTATYVTQRSITKNLDTFAGSYDSGSDLLTITHYDYSTQSETSYTVTSAQFPVDLSVQYLGYYPVPADTNGDGEADVVYVPNMAGSASVEAGTHALLKLDLSDGSWTHMTGGLWLDTEALDNQWQPYPSDNAYLTDEYGHPHAIQTVTLSSTPHYTYIDKNGTTQSESLATYAPLSADRDAVALQGDSLRYLYRDNASSINKLYYVYRTGESIGGSAFTPVVSNVAASQRTGTKLVDITYTITDVDSDSVTVGVEVSDDYGVTYTLPVSTLSGDYGSVSTVGTGTHNYSIVWDAGADWGGNFTNGARVKVTATD